MRKILFLIILFSACFSLQKSTAQVVLKSDTIEVACGAPAVILVPIRVRNFTDIAGLQFTYQWNPLQLGYAYITDINPAFSSISFDSISLIAQGKLVFAWTQLNSLTLPDDEILMNVAFTRIGGPTTPLSFVDNPTNVVVINGSFDEVLFSLESGAVKPLDTAPPTVTCPANTTVQAVGPVAVNDISPTALDDCGTPLVGWSSTGATTANFPNDSDASGAIFNIGSSTVIYQATDIVGNTATCSFQVTVDFMVGDELTFLPVIPQATCGQTIPIQVFAYNFDTIAAFQFSMGWDSTLLQFVSISNLNSDLSLTQANFGTGFTSSGQFSIAWNGPFTGNSLQDSTLLFTLNMTVLGQGDIVFGDVPTTRIALTGAMFPPEEIPMVTVDGLVFVVDNSPPLITCPSDVTVQAPGSIVVQNIAPLTFSDNCASPTVGWESTGSTILSAPGDADASGAFFNLGNSFVTYSVEDAGGNTASCSFQVSVEFGAGSSDLTLVAGSTNASCGGDFFINVTTLNFTEIAGLQFSMGWNPAIFQYTTLSNLNPVLGLDQSNFGLLFVNTGQLAFSWSTLSDASLVDGSLLFRIHFNLLGNTGSVISFTNIPTDISALAGPAFPPQDVPVSVFAGQVTMVDNTPPSIVCPANSTIDAPAGQLNALVNNIQPTVSDNCGAVPSWSFIRTGATTGAGSGNADGVFNTGTTNVQYTAVDDNNNTASCSFAVMVQSDLPVILHIDSIETDCQGGSGQVKHCITVDNFTDIIGLQFGLAWDNTVLQLVPPVTQPYPGLFLNQGMFFSYSTASDGLLLFFGNILNWPDIPLGDTLFCLNYNILDPGGNTTLVFQDPLNAVNAAFDPVAVQHTDGLFSSSADNTPPVVTCPDDISVTPPVTECNAIYLPPMPTAFDVCGAIASIEHVPVSNIYNTGQTTITYTVADLVGNTATCSYTLTVSDFSLPQVFNCPANITLNPAMGACSTAVTWTAPTFNDCSAITIQNDYAPGDIFPASCSPTTVTYKATDIQGNTSTCQFNVLVNDVELPTINCPSDIVVLPVVACDTIVAYAIPTASDLCDPNLDLGGSPLSGSVFVPGSTVVTWFAVDQCGNEAQCTFVITVVDSAPPTIANCPSNITVAADADLCGATVTWLKPTITDVCDMMPTVSESNQPGTFFNVGIPVVVNYTATDASGNFSTCTFSITVKDQTPPTLTNCPSSPMVVLLPSNSCDTILTWTTPTVDENCSPFTLLSNLNAGQTFTAGDTTVTYIVTDAAGYSDTCSFLISVRDLVPPVLSNCPANITVTTNGSCKVAVTWTDPVATDNCSVPTVTAPFVSGDEFMVGTTVVQIFAKDFSQNYDTCTFTITVIGIPPGFDSGSFPPNLTITACDTLMAWDLPVAIGFCNPVTVTSDPMSPTDFGPGVHTIVFTATDGVTTVTAPYVITVQDLIVPIMICPSLPIEVSTGAELLSGFGFITAMDTVAGCNAVELSFTPPGATDNCVVPVVTQSSGITSGSVFDVGTHVLTFVATDAAGNETECSVSIVVSPLPALMPTANPNPGCLDQDVVLTATAIQGAVYSWNKLPFTTLPSSTNEYTIVELNAQKAGDYAVLANVNGCSTPLETVNVILTPVADPQNDMFEIELGALDTFDVFLNDGFANPEEYEICATSPDPLPAGITPLGNGLFAVLEQAGETVSFAYQICYCGNPGEMTTVSIMVKDVSCSFIPNIITPNGDDLNDWFTIPCLDGNAFTNNSLVVYNQWGDKVFEDKGYTNDPSDPVHPAWRGTLNGDGGKDLPDGVYFYIFTPAPSEKPLKGFVEIFR